MIPSTVDMVDISGANTNAQRAKNRHKKVVTVTNTIWNPLSDIAMGVEFI